MLLLEIKRWAQAHGPRAASSLVYSKLLQLAHERVSFLDCLAVVRKECSLASDVDNVLGVLLGQSLKFTTQVGSCFGC